MSVFACLEQLTPFFSRYVHNMDNILTIRSIMDLITAAKSTFKGQKMKVNVSLYQKIPQHVSFLHSKMVNIQRKISHRAAPSSNLGQSLT